MHQTDAPLHHAPNAALLIDFDNVTLGVRSDLAKELRTLLNSEIIRGKVAVQRAYADWRRYPQYIVPLSESSIDLIFAPAFGTAKKNATDIRLAVDAVELIFTRPEIGTFMLLSGDSDFSSLVLKLKEYGKYVIGVGIRESASDILIQNCDEYYSYSDLAGLTREADVGGPPRDPWELVAEAMQQMVRNDDVMRADRLKQVMQQIDPQFDEGNAGYNRFSKFVTDAGARGLIRVVKQDNGQLEVAPAAAGAAPSTRGSRTAAPAAPAPATDAAPASRRRRGGRGGRGGGRAGAETAAGAAPAAPARASRPVITELTLAEAFQLLSRALGELPAPVAQDVLLARMATLYGKEDPLLEPVRFGKLLRQANDAEIADVRSLGDDRYEISPHKSDLALQMRPVETPPTETAGATVARPAAALRFRGGSRTSTRPADLHMVGVIDMPSSELTVESSPAVPIIETPAATSEEPVTAEPGARARTRRGKRGGKKHAGAAAAATADVKPDNASVAAAPPSAEPLVKTTTGAKKRSTRKKTSKPRAG
jgi:uncharacterized protein (TIGR00288 family)